MSYRRMRRPIAALFAIVSMTACGSGLPEESAGFSRPKPPPQPGSSITHTQMCSCKACPEGGCCFDARRPETKAPEGCGSSYDFSANEACSLKVETCTSRCYERAWRIPLGQSCADSQPADCCG